MVTGRKASHSPAGPARRQRSSSVDRRRAPERAAGARGAERQRRMAEDLRRPDRDRPGESARRPRSGSGAGSSTFSSAIESAMPVDEDVELFLGTCEVRASAWKGGSQRKWMHDLASGAGNVHWIAWIVVGNAGRRQTLHRRWSLVILGNCPLWARTQNDQREEEYQVPMEMELL